MLLAMARYADEGAVAQSERSTASKVVLRRGRGPRPDARRASSSLQIRFTSGSLSSRLVQRSPLAARARPHTAAIAPATSSPLTNARAASGKLCRFAVDVGLSRFVGGAQHQPLTVGQ